MKNIVNVGLQGWMSTGLEQLEETRERVGQQGNFKGSRYEGELRQARVDRGQLGGKYRGRISDKEI